MKAIILAAGKGERLKGVTKKLPKPMIELNGKPVLQHNIELCKKYGINDIYINLHHLPEIITNYFGNGEKFGVQIHYSYERELLGTAGAVRKIAVDFWHLKEKSTLLLQNSDNQSFPDFVSSLNSGTSHQLTSMPFLVLYGDNYSNYNLNLLIEKLYSSNSIAVVAFHYREDVAQSGVAEFDKDFKLIRFIEKPKYNESLSRWVNAGIYFVSPKIINFIPRGFSDFGTDIFPNLLNNGIPIYGVCENTNVIAFDTLEMYNKAVREINGFEK